MREKPKNKLEAVLELASKINKRFNEVEGYRAKNIKERRDDIMRINKDLESTRNWFNQYASIRLEEDIGKDFKKLHYGMLASLSFSDTNPQCFKNWKEVRENKNILEVKLREIVNIETSKRSEVIGIINEGEDIPNIPSVQIINSQVALGDGNAISKNKIIKETKKEGILGWILNNIGKIILSVIVGLLLAIITSYLGFK